MKLVFRKLRSFPAPIRILVFALLLLSLWLPFALPLNWLMRDRNLAGILTLLILYTQFIGLVRYWGRNIHRQPQVFRSYGLELSRQNGLLVLRGLGMGLFSVLFLFGFETLMGWIQWRSPSWNTLQIIVEGLIVSLALGFAEELLFRGWMLDELQRDYTPTVALWANAVLFAALHLRLATFPALVLLGAALVWAKRSHSRVHLGRRYALLGLPIGLHAGLVYGNYIIEVGKLIQYTDRVPAWVTGIDRNPLAGLLGVLFMAALAVSMWRYSKLQAAQASPKL
ncbi:MAG: type II CAAX endopeptidase family protein [Leptolyngbyaceae cyanobacterium bins.302]|nr:type II CAAX endopeptidase family protein [Leptolyngbyaceae cyanobacterium bins.302]